MVVQRQIVDEALSSLLPGLACGFQQLARWPVLRSPRDAGLRCGYSQGQKVSALKGFRPDSLIAPPVSLAGDRLFPGFSTGRIIVARDIATAAGRPERLQYGQCQRAVEGDQQEQQQARPERRRRGTAQG